MISDKLRHFVSSDPPPTMTNAEASAEIVEQTAVFEAGGGEVKKYAIRPAAHRVLTAREIFAKRKAAAKLYGRTGHVI
jgi:hypothetical protein